LVAGERERDPPEKVILITTETLEEGKGLLIGPDQQVLPVINLGLLKTTVGRCDRPSQ